MGLGTKLLIVLRAGSKSLHPAWSRVCAKAVDVAISIYDDLQVPAADFRIVHRCPGSKFSGLAAFFAECAWVLDEYTHFCLFEDDLYLPYASLRAIQHAIERYGFDLCAPSLAQESFISWPITVQNDAFELRATDFVEIMAPVMSRRFLARVLPGFTQNHSGWGYEWLWRLTLRELGTCAAVLDSAPIVHTRPMGDGSLYISTAANPIRPWEEATALFARHGIDKDAEPFRNFFGLARGSNRLVLGEAFTSRALAGYRLLARDNPDGFARCRDFLRTAPPPLESAEAIASFAAAPALLSAAAG
jgi:hypothetical protein